MILHNSSIFQILFIVSLMFPSLSAFTHLKNKKILRWQHFLTSQDENHSCNLLQNRHFLRNTFYALRHGRSLANEAQIIAASPEVACFNYGLSPEGLEQARKAGSQLLSVLHQRTKNITLLSSDLLRAAETAKIVQKSLEEAGCDVELTLDTRLRERGFGTWDGKHDSNYNQVWKNDAIDSSHTIDGVESVDSVTRRATSCVVELDELYSNGHVFVLVAHGDVLQILQTAFLKREGKFHRQIDHLETAQLRHLELAKLRHL